MATEQASSSPMAYLGLYAGWLEHKELNGCKTEKRP